MPEPVTVTVAQGALRGLEQTSKCQKTYYSFRGIPYAKPPVGSLRFKVSVVRPLRDMSHFSTDYLVQINISSKDLFFLLKYLILD
jgi:carboxylesterase 2